MTKAKIRKLEADEIESVYLQQVFLDGLLEYSAFTKACNVLQNELDKAEGKLKAEAVVCQWIEDCPEFKAEFEKAKAIVDRVNALKAEEFLNDMGSGKKGKEHGVTAASPVAAHMVLEAWDKPKWSQKVEVKKTENRTITTIVKHYGMGDTRVDVIDSPEVKELAAGDTDAG